VKEHRPYSHQVAATDPIDFDALRRVNDAASSRQLYHHILNSIGHDHSGTLYASAEQAVEPLIAIAIAEPGWPANTALEALLDMLGSFQSLIIATADEDVPAPGMKRRARVIAQRHRDPVG
jgi:hypothetical protein